MQSKQKTNNPTDNETLLELKNVSYNFDNIRALKNLNLDIKKSEIHAIVGDHGSGKSTLGMIICGAYKPRSGQIVFKNESYNYLNIFRAKKFKIEMVFQQIFLLDYFTVAENILISKDITNKRFFNKKSLYEEANAVLEKYGVDLDSTKLLKELQISEKMIVSILRSLHKNPELLILDASLEKLATPDLEKISNILKDAKKTGMSVICLTNRIDDIYNLADSVTILRNGELLLTDSLDTIDRINLIKMCYSQISKNETTQNLNQEFYQLLKYNEAILQKLPINLIVTDNKNKIKMINEYGQKYFNIENKVFNNITINTLFKKKNKEALNLIIKSLQEKKENAFYDVPLILKDHQASTINIKTFPIYDGAFLIGNIIIIEDVSKQESLRQQVILSEKLASVGLLAAGVAHEINNPLEIIYNYLNFLKFKLKQQPIIETIVNLEEEITYIKQIVSNLISFSDSDKIGTDYKKTIVEDFDLNELIKSIINLIKYNAKNKKIKINFNPTIKSLFFLANKNEIKQVILNLLKNSIEAINNGGIIDVATKEKNNKDILITIKDTGCGIQEDNPNNIFLPFYSTKKRGGSNLGLGLSVSYGIIKKYNGEIQVKNIKDSGCEFNITLPK